MTEIPEFLFEIAHELRTQDNRITAEPIFVVQSAQWVPEYDGCEDHWLMIEDDDPSYREITDDQDEALKASGCHPVKKEFIDKAWFFTEKGAQRYIDENSHNMNEPRIYVKSMYRCHEMIKLRNWILSLGENK